MKHLAITLAAVGLFVAPALADTFEAGVDRPGLDYTRFPTRSAGSCHVACRAAIAGWVCVAPDRLRGRGGDEIHDGERGDQP